jgi:hypothetical protein
MSNKVVKISLPVSLPRLSLINLVTQQRTTSQSTSRQIPAPTRLANSYYAILGLHPSASAIEIRRAYRQLSKLYHPDTTELSPAVATGKFQHLNEAYATLSNPERRWLYDLEIGYSRLHVIQTPTDLNQPFQPNQPPNSAYLDPSDRPLSAGEIFALFILGLTIVGCLVLVIAVSAIRGDELIPASALPQTTLPLNYNLPVETAEEVGSRELRSRS